MCPSWFHHSHPVRSVPYFWILPSILSSLKWCFSTLGWILNNLWLTFYSSNFLYEFFVFFSNLLSSFIMMFLTFIHVDSYSKSCVIYFHFTSTQWTWVWESSGSWWWRGKPGMLQSMGLQSRTWLSNWTELNWWFILFLFGNIILLHFLISWYLDGFNYVFVMEKSDIMNAHMICLLKLP